jgi:hypothetical protein
VRQFVLAKFRTTDIPGIESQIRDEVLKDEQVEAATVAVSLVGSDMTIAIAVRSGAGPFSLTLDVSAVTVEAVLNFNG